MLFPFHDAHSLGAFGSSETNRVQWQRSVGPLICSVTGTWRYCGLSLLLLARACVWEGLCVTPFTHLEAAYSTELLHWLQSQPNQSSPFPSHQSKLAHLFNLPSPASFEILYVILLFFFFCSYLHFFHITLVTFQSYLKTSPSPFISAFSPFWNLFI